MSAKRGQVFTHRTLLDPQWKPAPGQRYADGPKARMFITRVTKTAVYFGFDPSHGARYMDRAAFEAAYPNTEEN